MERTILSIITILIGLVVHAQVVVDAEDGNPLVLASVFNSKGTIIGMTDENGHLPEMNPSFLPLTVRYMGYDPLTVCSLKADTLRMTPTSFSLPEIAVGPVDRPVARMVVYVREYASMTTSRDTLDMYLDFMGEVKWTRDKVKKFKDGDRKMKTTSPVRGYMRRHGSGVDSIAPPNTEDIRDLSWDFLIDPPGAPVLESWVDGFKLFESAAFALGIADDSGEGETLTFEKCEHAVVVKVRVDTERADAFRCSEIFDCS